MSTMSVQNAEIRFKPGGFEVPRQYAVQNGRTEFVNVFCNIGN